MFSRDVRGRGWSRRDVCVLTSWMMMRSDSSSLMPRDRVLFFGEPLLSTATECIFHCRCSSYPQKRVVYQKTVFALLLKIDEDDDNDYAPTLTYGKAKGNNSKSNESHFQCFMTLLRVGRFQFRVFI